jgi:hypothetical protein
MLPPHKSHPWRFALPLSLTLLAHTLSAPLPVSQDLITNLPYITFFTTQSMTYWADGFPCAVVFECMVATGYVPSGIKTLVISSAWDGIVYAYGTSGAASESAFLSLSPHTLTVSQL